MCSILYAQTPSSQTVFVVVRFLFTYEISTDGLRLIYIATDFVVAYFVPYIGTFLYRNISQDRQALCVTFVLLVE